MEKNIEQTSDVNEEKGIIYRLCIPHLRVSERYVRLFGLEVMCRTAELGGPGSIPGREVRGI